MAMLDDFVLELISAPGNSATINLANTGSVTGRIPMASSPLITSGASVYYYMVSGALWEKGRGTFTAGTPPTLARSTVLNNSNGTTSRINFTGSTYVYMGIPAEYALYRDASNNIECGAADLRNMGTVAGGPISGFRNALINGDFRIWQRGTPASTTTGATSADCWKLDYDGSGSTFSVTQQGATDVLLLDQGIRNFWRCARTVAGSGGTYRQLRQRVEFVNTLAGKSVVVSFWGRADSSRAVSLLLTQNFGSTGSALVNSSAVGKTLTSSWQHFECAFTLASISGKTISGGDDYLQLTFNLPLNVTDTIEIADVQMQVGTALPAAMSERRPYQADLAMCRRYLSKVPIGWAAGAYNTTTVVVSGATPVPMRATPSVSWTGSGTVTQPGITAPNSTTAPTVTGYDTTSGGILIDWGGFIGLTQSAPGYISSLGSATFFLSAEL